MSVTKQSGLWFPFKKILWRQSVFIIHLNRALGVKSSLHVGRKEGREGRVTKGTGVVAQVMFVGRWGEVNQTSHKKYPQMAFQ